MSDSSVELDRLVQRIRQKVIADPACRGIPHPVKEFELELIQNTMGIELPAILGLVYTQIGGGYFGPGYGLLPLLIRDAADEFSPTVGQLYDEWRSLDEFYDEWCWDESLVPLCDWGCAQYGCIDTSQENCGVYRFNWTDVNPGDEPEDHLIPTHDSLTDWFEDWLSGGSCW